LHAKFEDAKLHTPSLTTRNSTAARREGAHHIACSQPRDREQISKQWEFGNWSPNCWIGLLIKKYGEKIFEVRFLDVLIAAAPAPHMASKQA
jgi:hypothetical protein